MEEQISKHEIERIIKTPGKVKGVVFVNAKTYILENKGQKGLIEVENKTKRMGCLINYQNIDPLEWYPVGFWVVSLLAIKKTFNWGYEEIFNMGNSMPKTSLITKMLLMYLVSVEKIKKQAPAYWKKHFTVGSFKFIEFNKDNKRVVMRLKGIEIHPICCNLLAGYFLRLAQYTIKSSDIKIKEIKCIHKGDPYHDFLVTWK